MGPGIIIPLLIVAIAVPVVFSWAKKNLKEGTGHALADEVVTPAARLTSNVLRELPSPPWRVVYEIADDKLGGIGHVLLGPGGFYAIRTSMDPMPAPSDEAPDPHDVAAAAIARGDLDDALRRCAMSSDLLVTVHWGAPVDGAPVVVDTVPGAVAVDGRALTDWVGGRPGERSPAQVDLAWQTVATAIGRPDPLV